MFQLVHKWFAFGFLVGMRGISRSLWAENLERAKPSPQSMPCASSPQWAARLTTRMWRKKCSPPAPSWRLALLKQQWWGSSNIVIWLQHKICKESSFYITCMCGARPSVMFCWHILIFALCPPGYWKCKNNSKRQQQPLWEIHSNRLQPAVPHHWRQHANVPVGEVPRCFSGRFDLCCVTSCIHLFRLGFDVYNAFMTHLSL